jgi:diketogulonate reductase-like aldo/keto reductase/HEAT repeat protein
MTLALLYATDSRARQRAVEDLGHDIVGAAYAARDVLLSDEDASVRAAAALFIERSRASSVAGALVDALYDTHPSVRMAACRALAKVRHPDAVAVLRRLAIEEPIWWVRRCAVLAVARIEREQAIPLLRAALDDPFWRVRHAAVRALVVLGGRHDAVVSAILAETSDSERAEGALRYLERRLRKLPRANEDEGVTGALEAVPIASTGGKIGDPDPAVIAARLEHGRVATLAELALYVGDPHEALRRAAAERLRACGDLRALLAAGLWLEEPGIPHATATVIALFDSLGPDVEDVLDAAVAEPDARPGIAAWALSYIANGERWDRLDDVIRALPSATPLVRRVAIAALGVLVATRDRAGADARSEAVVRLSAALHDVDEDVRRIALHGLIRAESCAAWTAALALPFDAQPALARRLLVVAADAMRDGPTLRIALRDSDPHVRSRALAALHIAGALEVEDVAAARAHPDPWIRGAVLDASTALDVLRRDTDPMSRRAAFQCAVKGGLATHAARIAHTDDDDFLRTLSAERLARSIEDEDLLRVLRLSRDPALEVRAAAADVHERSRDLPGRLARIKDAEDHPMGDAVVRDAAATWLGLRAPALMEAARAEGGLAVGHRAEPVVSREQPPREPVCSRRLGRTEIVLSPLVMSGANEPSIASLFRAMNAGCNAFFWEPRYRNLTAFLRAAGERGARPLVVAGTYHATERAIRTDVRRALRRLRRDRLDLFLVFWTRSPARLEGEVQRALERLVRDGLVRAVGFSTHDRALATRTLGEAPWDAVMVRHSAAHPGAEDHLFGRAADRGVGVLAFSCTSYGRLLASEPRAGASSVRLPTAAECYRYSLSQPGVTACVSAPRGGRELIENLAALSEPTLDAARIEELRAHGRRVREESLDFGRYIRRFPALPEAIDAELDLALTLATNEASS